MVFKFLIKAAGGEKRGSPPPNVFRITYTWNNSLVAIGVKPVTNCDFICYKSTVG